ncbi:HD domain-containing protein [Sphingomonas alpina]|uniref:N-methyl-D-aspartate receptor NMDAR2C subunit n=1 Tax=Sphingomonas alpina TaxID=653931 RepID=A0A7H0LEZ8_9SPHN|nr:N-methyl-D-aspartate receptor NMDAR2C subunit [Sphingomonas alpina]QNQ08251.1 N-methyl-D-aspartate receptor NMDAR2C subunit [Sphingomonas alpina]
MASDTSSRSAIATLLAAAPLAALERRYREPWRHYHAWEHPQAMLAHLDRAIGDAVPVVDPVACAGFILWHDAIYDPQAPHGRNEELSAALCAAEMAELAGPLATARAGAAILATIRHLPPDMVDCPDGALLLDIDLSILGQPAVVFDAYDRQIRAEYAHVEAGVYASARAGILRNFLARDRLFLTNWGFDQWEQRARDNLSGVIARLERQVAAA